MYLHNKYTRWYYNIIQRSQARILSKEVYTERHHIIPKSLGGSNSKENLVRLTAREHFVCHWLLVKMTSESNKIKMVYALHKMYSSNKKHDRYNTKITSRVFEKLKTEHAEYISKMNSGRVMTEEQKQKLSSAMLGKNKGKVRTEEQKQHLRNLNTGKRFTRSEETKQKLSAALVGKNTGKKRTAEQKEQMSQSIKQWWAERKG